ncbi:MAG: TetR-like C-terminal domain-containing protein [Peptostreptococcus porci]|nr:TetR-like C-terminal domain-containing protein [Peptostreptococcus porci]
MYSRRRQVIFKSRLESSFIKQKVKRIYIQTKEQMQINDERIFQISFQYNYHGALGVIKEWLEDGCQYSPNELGDLLFTIVEKQYK